MLMFMMYVLFFYGLLIENPESFVFFFFFLANTINKLS